MEVTLIQYLVGRLRGPFSATALSSLRKALFLVVTDGVTELSRGRTNELKRGAPCAAVLADSIHRGEAFIRSPWSGRSVVGGGGINVAQLS